jgi:hypothetical protein
MEDRRAFLRLAVFGLASTALVPSVAAARAPTAPDASDAGAPWWLLHPLLPGSDVGLGWRVARLFPAVQGAVTLNLVHDDGRAARIDLSLREGAARGPAATACVDFIVMDGGNGGAPMDESLGRVLRRIAAIVAENEERNIDTLARLEPHADRVWRHADALAVASTRLSPT